MTITLKDGFNTPQAVVDWLAFTVELGRTSHGGYLKNTYAHLGVSHAYPLNKGDGGAATQFEFRMQHPANYAVIEEVITDLEKEYGFVITPKLLGLEVSLDFYHKSTSILALKAMTERLMLSITPPRIINPRIYGKNCDFSGGHMPSRREIKGLKTLYIGNEDCDVLWRVYFKRTDDTFIGENGKKVPKPIPFKEFRARAEVRLQGAILEQFNLVSVSDLRNFRFEKLHSEGLFKFAKRDYSSGQIITNKFSISGAKSLGVNNDSPVSILNLFGRRDSRGRERQLSRHLITDTELTEASRQSLRRLTQRF